uniref:Uncharacterized protein n=1 Tax=Anguilla anguilla TaxID=7936 RepID=A0A0E9UNJ7_ANGAN
MHCVFYCSLDMPLKGVIFPFLLYYLLYRVPWIFLEVSSVSSCTIF